MIRILVADDQPEVRDGLVTVLSLLDDIEVVGEAVDGVQAVELCASLQPDVVLMDLRMPVLGGAEATARIVAAQPTVAVLVLTTYADDDSILGALRAGARGYLTKDAGRGELEAAIRSVVRGQATFAPGVGARLIERLAPAKPLAERFPALTARELEVLELIVRGLSNPEIAAAAFISVATVKTHVNSIFAKLGVADRGKLIALAR
ncbi:MAG: response regulator transcription factor [Actinomycetota bacterium]